MVSDGFASFTIPVSDGDVIAVDIEPVVDDGGLSRELRLAVPMGITAGEILAALSRLGLDPATPVVRVDGRDDLPRRMIIFFRLP